jgi:hypothetical protein
MPVANVATPTCRTVARYSGHALGKEQSNFYSRANSCPNGVLQDSSGFDIVPNNAVGDTDKQHFSP